MAWRGYISKLLIPLLWPRNCIRVKPEFICVIGRETTADALLELFPQGREKEVVLLLLWLL